MFRTYLIGRSKQADLIIDDPSISRLHAEFTITKSGRYFYVDRGSTHGSSLLRHGNSTPLKQGFVEAGDTLIVGTHPIQVRDIAKHMLPLRSNHKQQAPAFEPISFTPRSNAGNRSVGSSR